MIQSSESQKCCQPTVNWEKEGKKNRRQYDKQTNKQTDRQTDKTDRTFTSCDDGLSMKSPNHRHQMMCHMITCFANTLTSTHKLQVQTEDYPAISFPIFLPLYLFQTYPLWLVHTVQLSKYYSILVQVLGFYKVHIHPHKLVYTKLLHQRPTHVGKLNGVVKHTLQYNNSQ